MILEPPIACWFSWYAGQESIALDWRLGLAIVEDALVDWIQSGGTQSPQFATEDHVDTTRDCQTWFLTVGMRRAWRRLAQASPCPAPPSKEIPFRLPHADTLQDFLQNHLRLGEFPGKPRPVDTASMKPLPDGNHVCVSRCGTWKDARIRREFDARFGIGRWRTGYTWGDCTLDVRSGIQIYEDAYLQVLNDQPELLDWVVGYGDAYDTNPSNVRSYCDYSNQEVEGATQHWQDISVRRVLRRLGLWFQGDALLEIRGHQSEGYRLNPGQVPFHRPDLFVRPRQYGWWKPGSIEDFAMSNFAVQTTLDDASEYLGCRTPDQEACELILAAQHRTLFPEMIRFATVGGARTHLFLARTLQLMSAQAQREFYSQGNVPAAAREVWGLIHSVSQEEQETVDRLLSNEPEVRREGLSQVARLEGRLRHCLLTAVCEDPARRLRNKAKEMLTATENTADGFMQTR